MWQQLRTVPSAVRIRFRPPSVAAALLLLFSPAAMAQRPSDGGDDRAPTGRGPASSVLTTGPVHEALVGTGTVHGAEGDELKAPKPAPTPLPERPSARPSADAVWVDGYWHWSTRERDFIWLPGFWRYAPRGVEWQPGQWRGGLSGSIWRPGAWLVAGRQPVVVRSAPPPDRGREATRGMIGDDAFWVRGHWTIDAAGEYAWREGYIARPRAGLSWQPARWVSLPGGHALLDGFWDLQEFDRGTPLAAIRPPRESADASPERVGSRPIDLDSVIRDLDGSWIYTRTLPSAPAPRPMAAGPVVLDPPEPLGREPLIDGTATIDGTVRKGRLTPARIDVRLLGGPPATARSDDQGRFRFTDVPYGRYRIVADGAVQNTGRRGGVTIDVERANVQVDIEMD